MEFLIGFIVGGIVIFAICFFIFASWVNEFIKNFWR